MTPEELVNELTRLRLKDGDIVVWRTNDPGAARECLVDMWKDRAFAKDVGVLLIRPDEGFDVLDDEDLANVGLWRVAKEPEFVLRAPGEEDTDTGFPALRTCDCAPATLVRVVLHPRPGLECRCGAIWPIRFDKGE